MYSCWAETLETDTENLATDTPDADRNVAAVWANAADTTDPDADELLLEREHGIGKQAISNASVTKNENTPHRSLSSILHHTLEERYQHLT